MRTVRFVALLIVGALGVLGLFGHLDDGLAGRLSGGFIAVVMISLCVEMAIALLRPDDDAAAR